MSHFITDSRIVWKTVKYIAIGVGTVTAVAVPAVIAAVGFTTVGVAAGESDSNMYIYMRSSISVPGSAAAAAQAAIGNVAAGSFFAIMQSIGTMPLLVGVLSGLAGALLVVFIAAAIVFFWRRGRAKKSNY